MYGGSLTELDEELPFPNERIVATLANSDAVRSLYNL